MKYVVSGQIQRHGMLQTGADVFLSEAKAKVKSGERDGVFYYWLASLLFSAFEAEAFVNTIGSKLLGDGWPDRLNWQEKIKLIHSIKGKKADFGSEPLQTIVRIFKMRDNWVHSKLEYVNGAETGGSFPPDRAIDPLTSSWEKDASEHFAEMAQQAVSKLREELFSVSEIEYFETLTFGSEGIAKT